MAKLIVVFGGTGAQGGSVAKALSKDADFTVRATGMDIEGELGAELRKLGIETLNSDMCDKESIQKSLVGAYGCFVVTNTDFKIKGFYEKEVQQGKNVSDVCKDEGIEHVVFSTIIPEMYKQFNVPCAELDAKVEIHDYMKGLSLPVSGIMMSFYYENILTVFRPQKLGDGKMYGFGVPLGKVGWAMASVEDMGEIVRQIFRQKDTFMGQDVQVIKEKRTLQEMCDTLNKHLEPAVFRDLRVSLEQFRKLPMPNIDQISNLFEITIKAQNIQPDTATAAKLNPNMRSFDEWVQQNTDKLKKLYN